MLRNLKRSYSIASAPEGTPRFEIAVTQRVGGPGLDVAPRGREPGAQSFASPGLRASSPGSSGRRAAVAHDRDRDGRHASAVDDARRGRRGVRIAPTWLLVRGASTMRTYALRIRDAGAGRADTLRFRFEPTLSNPPDGHMGGTTGLRPEPTFESSGVHLGGAGRRHASRVRLRVAAHGGVGSGHPEEGARRSARDRCTARGTTDRERARRPTGFVRVRAKASSEMTDLWRGLVATARRPWARLGSAMTPHRFDVAAAAKPGLVKTKVGSVRVVGGVARRFGAPVTARPVAPREQSTARGWRARACERPTLRHCLSDRAHPPPTSTCDPARSASPGKVPGRARAPPPKAISRAWLRALRAMACHRCSARRRAHGHTGSCGDRRPRTRGSIRPRCTSACDGRRTMPRRRWRTA
jgi:hypothetical protein